MELAHYTSISNVLKILQKDGLHFHLSRYSDMNEPHEIEWSRRELKRTANFIENDEDVEYIYVLSLSKNIDDLTMWRLYGAECSGVCFVLDLDGITKVMDVKSRTVGDESSNCICGPVIYGLDRMGDVKQMIDKFKHIGLYSNELACAFIKPDGFKSEGEYRFCHVNRENCNFSYNQLCQYSQSNWEENTAQVDVKCGGNGLIRYVEKIIPASSLKRIIVGGDCNKNTEEIIQTYINNLDGQYKSVKINRSDYPLI